MMDFYNQYRASTNREPVLFESTRIGMSFELPKDVKMVCIPANNSWFIKLWLICSSEVLVELGNRNPKLSQRVLLKAAPTIKLTYKEIIPLLLYLAEGELACAKYTDDFSIASLVNDLKVGGRASEMLVSSTSCMF